MLIQKKGRIHTLVIGASMAMESAAAPSDELSRTDTRFVEQALDLYEKRHRKRVESAQQNSCELAKMNLVESLRLVWGRDQVMKFVTVEMLLKDIAKMIDEPIKIEERVCRWDNPNCSMKRTSHSRL